MNGKQIVLGAAVVALLSPLAGATDTTSCRVTTTTAFELDGHYMVGTAAEFWQEDNGIPGLQRSESSCLGRDALPADRCITHRENGALVSCLSTYPASLVA